MKLKTRTNQPVYYKLPVSSDIEHLSDGLLNSLKVGDVVQKKTGNQKHCYIVTYKGDGAGEGICLTYVACGYMETISYDRSGSSWVFNSKDVCEVPSDTHIQEIAQSSVLEDKTPLLTTLTKGENNYFIFTPAMFNFLSIHKLVKIDIYSDDYGFFSGLITKYDYFDSLYAVGVNTEDTIAACLRIDESGAMVLGDYNANDIPLFEEATEIIVELQPIL